MNTKQLKQALRQGKFAWPGGYPRYFVTEDGAALSFDTVCKEFRTIVSAMRDGRKDSGWYIACVDINWEDPALFDDHSGERIESAYAEDEAQS